MFLGEFSFALWCDRSRRIDDHTQVLQHAQRAPLAVAQLGSCTSSGRAWRLWAAQHSQGAAPAYGRPATATVARASDLQSRRFHCLSLWPSRCCACSTSTASSNPSPSPSPLASPTVALAFISRTLRLNAKKYFGSQILFRGSIVTFSSPPSTRLYRKGSLYFSIL